MKGSAIRKSTFACLAIILFFITLASNSFAATKWLASIENSVNVPTRIAMDSEGNTYVTEPRTMNRLLVFDRHGNLIKRLNGLKGPIGVAIDSNKQIYVGNADSGNVSVYDADLAYSHKLGFGDGEFKSPNSIAVSGSGLIYVADSKDHVIKVYNPDGSKAFSFGGWGKGNGEFNVPLDMAIDEALGELYVADLGVYTDPVNGQTAGARIQVFNLNGGYLRNFGQYGLGEGRLLRPLGIAFKDGKIYVSDGYQALVKVYDANGNFIESIYDTAHQLKTPIGVAVGKDGRVFVASSNGPSIEIFGFPGYTTMTVAPLSISIEAEEGMAPAAQAASISNTGEGVLNWTASADQAWIDLSLASGATQPATATDLLIGIKIAGLAVGTYTGKITVTAESGATDTIAVNLIVIAQPKILSVKPSSLSFKAQINGMNPAAQVITIENLGKGDMTWTASTNQPWLLINALSGTAPATASVNVNIAGLNAGVYSGDITVDAPGAQGSPAKVNVTLSVTNSGTVTVATNLASGGFDITGPTSYSVAGTDWTNDEVPPGDYTIIFRHVTGYIKPYTRTFTVKTGREVAIDGTYRVKPAATHIIAGSGGTKGKKVEVLTLTGKLVTSFEPFKSPEEIKVAAGDLDASGTDKIVVTDRKRRIKVYTYEGIELASLELPEWYKNTEVTLGDIDNDGKADIIIGAENDRHSRKAERRIIKLLSYNYTDGKAELKEKETLFTEDKDEEFTIAAGDINGDGKIELMVADENNVRAFNIDLSAGNNKLTEIWAIKGDYEDTPEIATGDINDDGIYEIALGIETEGEKGEKGEKGKKGEEERAIIRILKGNGEDYGLKIEPYKDLGYEGAPTVALGDIDGDGVDEIAAGAGRDEDNEPLIRLYESDGAFTNTTIKASGRKNGVNITLGRFK